MTTTQLNTATKATLIEYVTKLQAESQDSAVRANEALKIANYFANVLGTIEKAFENAPFLNQEGKFFKKLYWVLTNFSEIKNLIELVVTQIKAWRLEVNKLVAQTTPPPTEPTTEAVA